MIRIRNFQRDDIAVLKRMYERLSEEEIYAMLEDWNTYQFGGKYFESFAVCLGESIVGNIFLCQHNGYIISGGPEIFPEYRRCGYATEALRLAYEHAKSKGYKIASAQIRKDNVASIRLHEKLGFILDTEIINRHGNEMNLYLKLL